MPHKRLFGSDEGPLSDAYEISFSNCSAEQLCVGQVHYSQPYCRESLASLLDILALVSRPVAERSTYDLVVGRHDP